MNISSVQSIAIPDISGETDAPRVIQSKIAFAAATKVLHAQKEVGAALVALLDPNVGRSINASA
jgi:hypothetical protein